MMPIQKVFVKPSLYVPQTIFQSHSAQFFLLKNIEHEIIQKMMLIFLTPCDLFLWGHRKPPTDLDDLRTDLTTGTDLLKDNTVPILKKCVINAS